MNIFNKSQQGASEGESFEGIEEIENTQTLAAPARARGFSSSGKKNIIAIVLMVAFLGGGYMLFGRSAPAPVTSPTRTETPPPETTSTETMAPVENAMTQATAPTEEMPSFPPMPEVINPPEQQDALANAAAPAPEIPPVEMPLEMTPPESVLSGMDRHDFAAPPVATDPAVDPVLPPDATIMPSPDVATLPPSPPQDFSLPPETISTAATPAPIPSMPAAIQAVPPSGFAQPVTPPLPSVSSGATPSAAEMAIVQNAAMLDQLSQPAPISGMPPSGGAQMTGIDEILGQEAVVRPLPEEYLIVKKDKQARSKDSILKAARLALSQNRDAAALELFNEMQKEHPDDGQILMGKAITLQKLGQDSEALAVYEEVLSHDPKNVEVLTNMLGLLKAQDPGLALKSLIELQEVYPYNADITAQLAISYAGAGQYEQAMKYLNVADALKPGSAYVLYNRAVLLDKTGHRAEAGDLYRKIIRMHADGDIDISLPIEAIKTRLSTLR